MQAILESINPLQRLEEIKKEVEINNRIFDHAMNYSKKKALKFWSRFNENHYRKVQATKLTLKTI